MAAHRSLLLRAAIVLLSLLGTACPPRVDGASRPAELAHVERIAVLRFAVPPDAPPALSRSMADDLAAQLAGSFRVVEGDAPGDVDAVLLGRVLAYRDRASTPDADTALAVSVRLVDVRTREDVLAASSEASAAASFCAQDMVCLRAKITRELAGWLRERAAGARSRAGCC
jgi:hypothetical protein